MNTGGGPVTSKPIPPQVWQLDAASLSDANKALRILPRELVNRSQHRNVVTA